MPTPTRSITLYWLLLLLPTLAVGVGAIYLLHRERTRLREGATEAEAVARAAVEARASIVAENAGLLITEIQRSLMESLRLLPDDALEPSLARLETDNPLVRTTFLCRSDGTLLRPQGEEYLRRFERLLTTDRPWSLSTPPAAQPKAEVEAAYSQAEKRLMSNRMQRQGVEDEARKVVQLAQASSSAYKPSAAPARSEESDAVAVPAERSGWVPWFADNELFVLGWLQPGGSGDVRGVEIDLAVLVSRLAVALPAEVGPGERYVLRNDRGRILHQVGGEGMDPGAMPVLRLSVSDALPHWEVVAWSLPVYARSAGAGAWFLLATLLVGSFVAAILAGGLLLLLQARRSERDAMQKTSFVANVSHEFKTPLTTIRLYSELLAQGRVSDPSRQAEYLHTIGRETQRLARLVGNALDFSRLEQGKKKYQPERVDLSTVVAAVLDAQAPRFEELGVRVIRSLPAPPCTVTTDRDALEQILLNLIDNACKYAASGGEISVAVSPGATEGVQVSVGDRGPGVPADHAERIFEKFHRVDDTLTAEQGGAGLGLGIARQLARGLGGDVVYRPREGGGALFVLQLP